MYSFPVRTTRRFVCGIVASSCLCFGPSVDAQEEGAPPKAIRIQARKNPGNVPYRFFIDGQKSLRGYLPAEPCMLDEAHHKPLTEQQLRQRFGEELPPADFDAARQAGTRLAASSCPRS